MASDQNIVVEAEVASMAKNATQTIEARLTRCYGKACGDVRVFATDATGKAVATRAGLCIRREQLPELGRLVAALIEAAGVEVEGDEAAEE